MVGAIHELPLRTLFNIYSSLNSNETTPPSWYFALLGLTSQSFSLSQAVSLLPKQLYQELQQNIGGEKQLKDLINQLSNSDENIFQYAKALSFNQNSHSQKIAQILLAELSQNSLQENIREQATQTLTNVQSSSGIYLAHHAFNIATDAKTIFSLFSATYLGGLARLKFLQWGAESKLATGLAFGTEVSWLTGIGTADAAAHGEKVSLSSIGLQTFLTATTLGIFRSTQSIAKSLASYVQPEWQGLAQLALPFIAGTSGFRINQGLQNSLGFAPQHSSEISAWIHAASEQLAYQGGSKLGQVALGPNYQSTLLKFNAESNWITTLRKNFPQISWPEINFDLTNPALAYASANGNHFPAIKNVGTIDELPNQNLFRVKLSDGPPMGVRTGGYRYVSIETLGPPLPELPKVHDHMRSLDASSAVKNILAYFNIPEHSVDIEAFQDGYWRAQNHPERMRETAWDFDEVQTHWAMSIAKQLTPGKRDPHYHGTPAEALNYQPHQPKVSSPLWYKILFFLRNFRIRQHLQFQPGVRAYLLGVRMGLGENINLCTTGPLGRFFIIANEDPALKYIYYGKLPHEAITAEETRQAPNLIFREHLVLAMEQAGKIEYPGDENPWIADYISRLQTNPKKGVKFKHPAVPLLLTQAGMPKNAFVNLVDDSGSTFKMLGNIPGFAVYKVPSHRPGTLLNFTLGTTASYLDRMTSNFVAALDKALAIGKSVDIKEEQATPVDYPHQRLMVDSPYWRHNREYFSPAQELKALAQSIAQKFAGFIFKPSTSEQPLSLTETLHNDFWFVRHGESVANTQSVLRGDLREDFVNNNKLTPNGIDEVKIKTMAWIMDNRTRIQQAINEGKLVIYASPFIRTQQTAKIIAEMIGEFFDMETAPAITTDYRIREKSFGQFEGQHYQSPDSMPFTKQQHPSEASKTTSARMYDFIRDVDLQYANTNHLIIAVTHNHPLRLALGLRNGLSPMQVRQQFRQIDNGSFHHFPRTLITIPEMDRP